MVKMDNISSSDKESPCWYKLKQEAKKILNNLNEKGSIQISFNEQK
jgi:hypothetical protein